MSEEQAPTRPDFSGQIFGFTMDAPIVVGIDPDTGGLYLEGTHQLQMFGAALRVTLPPEAAGQLATRLKQIESMLGKPIEDLAKRDSVQ